MLIDTQPKRRSRSTVYVIGFMFHAPGATHWTVVSPARWIVKAETMSEALGDLLKVHGSDIVMENAHACLGDVQSLPEHKWKADFVNAGDGWERILYISQWKDFDTREEKIDVPLSIYATTVMAFGVKQDVRIKVRKMLRKL